MEISIADARALIAILENDETAAAFYLLLGKSYEDEGSLDLAEEVYLEGLRIKSDCPTLNIMIAAFYLKLERHQACIEYGKRAIATNSEPLQIATLHSMLFYCYMETGDHVEAIIAGRTALRLDPNVAQNELITGMLQLAKETPEIKDYC